MDNTPVETVQLSTVIDFLVQKTYHELTVLSELLPRKDDIDRKIEIVQFSYRTRQLFIRLLALVKWINSAAKVDKCMGISKFLAHQSKILVSTADSLAILSRQVLPKAKLPTFSVSSAIDVITAKTYPRLPTCIKTKIVSEDVVSDSEKESLLTRLNQIIQYRLVTQDLPSQLSDLKISEGKVTFTVVNEFTTTLTLMSDDNVMPWRLLWIQILVNDPDTGDGKELVHHMQVQYMHKLVQSQLFTQKQPLWCMYKCLHWFCQCLQLEVLNSQASKLVYTRWGQAISLDTYHPGSKLRLLYWKERSASEAKIPANLDQSSPYLINVSLLENHTDLQITHSPELKDSYNDNCKTVIQSGRLSIERLLVYAILGRSHQMLADLKIKLSVDIPGCCSYIEEPFPTLRMSLLDGSTDDEKLQICVDLQTGLFSCEIRCIPEVELYDLESSFELHNPIMQSSSIEKLRLELRRNRIKSVIQCLPSFVVSPPIDFHASHPFRKLTGETVSLKLIHHQFYYIVVELLAAGPHTSYKYYLLHCQTQPESLLLAPLGWAELTHNQWCPPPAKRIKADHGCISNLKEILAVCDRRLNYVELCQEFESMDIIHEGIDQDSEDGYRVVTPTLPALSGIMVLECSFRLVDVPCRMWRATIIFDSNPLGDFTPISKLAYKLESHKDMSGLFKRLHVDTTAMAKLYVLVERHMQYNVTHTDFATIQAFNFLSIVIHYGDTKSSSVTIKYDTSAGLFTLQFGIVGPASAGNCHSLVKHQLQFEFNQYKSLALLLKCLNYTQSPLQSMAKLSSFPVLGLISKPSTPMQNFYILPQSSTHIHIVFRNTYCLDFYCGDQGKVAVKDAAYYVFDSTKSQENYTPCVNLQGFLSAFYDDGRPVMYSEGMDSVTLPRGMSPRTQSNPTTPASPYPRSNPLISQSPMMAGSSPEAWSIQPSPAMPSPAARSPRVIVVGDLDAGISPAVRSVKTECSKFRQLELSGMRPIKLSHDALHRLLTPHVPEGILSLTHQFNCCPLERFLGTTFMKQHLQRIVLKDGIFNYIPTPNEPNVLQFNIDSGLQCRVALSQHIQQSLHMQTLVMRIQSSPEHSAKWTQDDISTLEKFFMMKVSCPPFKANAMTAFARLLTAPQRALKDCIQIMKMELNPSQPMKWMVRWCLTVPPNVPPIAAPGTAGIVMKLKLFFILQLTNRTNSQEVVIVPIMYDPASNTVSMAENPKPGHQHVVNPMFQSLNSHIRRFMEWFQSNPYSTECSILHLVKDLVNSLTL